MTVIDTLEMNKWNEAALLDRIVVWDRWIEKGIAPEGTKEARDAAMQIIIQRVERLRAERDRLREALTKIAASSRQLPGQMFVAFAREVLTQEALKETGHEADE
jgi:hypothetical protein